jgi:hypothetical protein
MAVAVVTPVLFCAKATEKFNKYTKICSLLEIILFMIISCKNIVIHVSLIVAWPEPEL